MLPSTDLTNANTVTRPLRGHQVAMHTPSFTPESALTPAKSARSHSGTCPSCSVTKAHIQQRQNCTFAMNAERTFTAPRSLNSICEASMEITGQRLHSRVPSASKHLSFVRHCGSTRSHIRLSFPSPVKWMFVAKNSKTHISLKHTSGCT